MSSRDGKELPKRCQTALKPKNDGTLGVQALAGSGHGTYLEIPQSFDQQTLEHALRPGEHRWG